MARESKKKNEIRKENTPNTGTHKSCSETGHKTNE